MSRQKIVKDEKLEEMARSDPLAGALEVERNTD